MATGDRYMYIMQVLLYSRNSGISSYMYYYSLLMYSTTTTAAVEKTNNHPFTEFIGDDVMVRAKPPPGCGLFFLGWHVGCSSQGGIYIQ